MRKWSILQKSERDQFVAWLRGQADVEKHRNTVLAEHIAAAADELESPTWAPEEPPKKGEPAW